MAYEPAIVSFILVGTIGGVAVIMNASSGWEISHDLSRLTQRWTLRQVIRTYGTDARARERRAREADILQSHGYTSMEMPEGTLAARGSDIPTGSGGRIVIVYQLP